MKPFFLTTSDSPEAWEAALAETVAYDVTVAATDGSGWSRVTTMFVPGDSTPWRLARAAQRWAGLQRRACRVEHEGYGLTLTPLAGPVRVNIELCR